MFLACEDRKIESLSLMESSVLSFVESLRSCVFFLVERRMTTLDLTRAELALIVLYLNKAEARDKICRAIQYGSKFVSGGQPGTAQIVDKNTSLARKVFRLFKV